MPLKFELGEAFQFDWSEEGLVIGGVCAEAAGCPHEAVRQPGLLCWWPTPARATRCCSTPTRGSFAALGGIPRRGIYDNMKTAVDRVRQGKGRDGQCPLRGDVLRTTCSTPTSATSPRAGRRASSRRTCRIAGGASGWKPGSLRFGSFAELNAWLLTRCQALWQEIAPSEYAALSVAEMLELEQPHLMPMADGLRRLRRRAGAASPAPAW